MSARAALSVNGKIVPLDGTHLNARDRGFLLGDSIFETLRLSGGAALRWDRHLSRLRQGGLITGIPIPWNDGQLTEIVRSTVEAGGLSEAVVRLTISRGVSEQRGLLPDSSAKPTIIVHAAPFDGYPKELYQRGMKTIISSVRRNEHSVLSRVKSSNYLDNILARQEAAKHGADEALLLNTAGVLCGASAANLFIVLGGTLVTPSIDSGALPGTVRGTIVDHAPYRVEERVIDVSELMSCQEAFLTNALLGVMPLTSVGSTTIASGTVGTVTSSITTMLSDLRE